LGCLPARFPYEYCPADEKIGSETQIENWYAEKIPLF
jgi:hypothetical protein